MQNRYELVIYWSEEDQRFIAEVPELPGCMADGHSYQEAVNNVEVIVGEWVVTAQQLGRPVPQPMGGNRGQTTVFNATVPVGFV